MQLERIAFTARPRKPWEAADLGLQFTRLYYWRLIKLCFLITLPLYLLLEAIWPNTGVSVLIIWWLKPLWERVILVVLSQAVFQSPPSTRQSLRDFKSIVWRQAFAAITWRRLSPSRSFNLPVIQLEALKGEQYRSRLSILHRGNTSPALWLTIIGVHLETLLSLGAFILAIYLIPTINDFSEPTGLLEFFLLLIKLLIEFSWLFCLLYYLSMLLVAPFYISSGFFLYLNRRIVLEGWDIELVFRQMAASHKKATPSLAKSTIALILASVLFFWHGPAQEVYAATTAETPEAAKTLIEEVLNSEDFHQIEKTHKPKLNLDWDWSWDWNWDDDLEDKKTTESGLLIDFALAIAPFFEVIIWSLVIALILLAVFRYRHWLLALGQKSKNKTEPSDQPKTLFGLDVSAESLPDDVPTAVMRHWQNQQHREAIGLLYRALLNQLITLYQVPITSGDTEGDCITKAKPLSNTQLTQYLMDLTKIWLQLAYAHQLPPESMVKDLCQRWHGLSTKETTGEANV